MCLEPGRISGSQFAVFLSVLMLAGAWEGFPNAVQGHDWVPDASPAPLGSGCSG